MSYAPCPLHYQVQPRDLFSHRRHALTNKIKRWVALNKDVYQALDDFRWILKDVSTCPTRIVELVPLLHYVEGHHDTLGLGAGEYGSLTSIWSPEKDLTTSQ